MNKVYDEYQANQYHTIQSCGSSGAVLKNIGFSYSNSCDTFSGDYPWQFLSLDFGSCSSINFGVGYTPFLLYPFKYD